MDALKFKLQIQLFAGEPEPEPAPEPEPEPAPEPIPTPAGTALELAQAELLKEYKTELESLKKELLDTKVQNETMLLRMGAEDTQTDDVLFAPFGKYRKRG